MKYYTVKQCGHWAPCCKHMSSDFCISLMKSMDNCLTCKKNRRITSSSSPFFSDQYWKVKKSISPFLEYLWAYIENKIEN